MAASVKIEFDDGSRVISQTLEDAAGFMGEKEHTVRRGDIRSSSCSLEDYFEVCLLKVTSTNFLVIYIIIVIEPGDG